MPFYKEISLSSTTKVFLWKITEDFNELYRSVSLKDSSLFRLEKMKSESHQKGFLAVRMLLQHCGYNDFDLEYDETGKPNLLEDKLQISISHSGEFSAIAISEEKIGIDLEKVKEKVLRISPRFMDVSHLENLSTEEQIKKATIVWGIKESIFKIKNEVGISFPEHIFEHEFTIDNKICSASLNFDNKIEHFNIAFDFIEDYALVCAFKKK